MTAVRFTPAGAPRVDVHHVPGLAPFVTVEFKDADGSVIVMEVWQPATATLVSQAIGQAGYALATEMARPAPQEG